MKTLLCWFFGHVERSDWFFGMLKHRRPVHMTWCHRCGVTLAHRRAKRRHLKHIWPVIAQRWSGQEWDGKPWPPKPKESK